MSMHCDRALSIRGILAPLHVPKPRLVVAALTCVLLHAHVQPVAAQAPADRSDARVHSLVFDTYTPGPCSPNGQAQGNCDPGELVRVRLVPVAEGLRQPRHIAFIPGTNDMLVTEPTEIRLVRDGKLVEERIAGFPAESLDAGTLQSVIAHPDFAATGFIYVYYVKRRGDGATTLGLARGRLEGLELADVEEIFVADGWMSGGPIAGRAEFGPDGMIFLTLNDQDRSFSTDDTSVRILAQDVGSDIGKVMRVRDDGAIPADNPFVGQAWAKPEVFSYGHRNVTGFAWHPETGELWATEIAPMGGDELNLLRAGANYGWPHVSLGRIYNNSLVSEQSWWRPGMEMPAMHWTPSISPSGAVFYTGERIPQWQGHLFIGALNGQMLQRVAFDQPGAQSERREALFIELGRRFRHVEQGPDGYLYVATVIRILGANAPDGPNMSGTVYRIEAAE